MKARLDFGTRCPVVLLAILAATVLANGSRAAAPSKRVDGTLVSEKGDAPAVRALIGDLQTLHGARYASADPHRRDLLAADGAVDGAERRSRLRRAVLLFDVTSLLAMQRHEIDSSHVYTYHNEGFRPGGGLYRIPVEDGLPAEPVELVASPNGQILDCDLSYDGRTVLFAWRREAGAGYHLWTVGVDGAGLRQLTSGAWHDYNGCWLPDGGIAFVSTRDAQFAYCWNSPVGVVHRMDRDGGQVRRLSANYLNDFTPYPLADGRLIYSRWEYVDKPAIPIQSLWTINPDGTGLAGYFGNRVLSPGTFMEARSIPGTEQVVCTMTGHNGPARGAIGVIDRSRGANAQGAIRNVTPDVPLPNVDQGNGNFDGTKLYSTPVPLDRVRFLVSARGPVLVRDFAGTCETVVLPAPAAGRAWFCAQPLREREPPNPPPRGTTASGLATGPAERGGEQTEPGSSPGVRDRAYLFVQDVYHGLEPWVKRGEVKRLRVVRELPKTVRIHPDRRAFGFQFPVISAGATYAGKEVLGEVPVEADGSAAFAVPSGVPIYFMALDAEGRGIQRMRSFTHLMPGEVQGCVGCHADRSGGAPLTTARAPTVPVFRDLEPPEWGRGGFDYANVVQPVLDAHCGKCHAGENPEGKVDLSGDRTDYFNVSYETLARGRRQWGEAQYDSPYVSWIPTYNGFETNILLVTPRAWGSPRSHLADLLLDGHPDREGRTRVALPDAARRRILAWIDLNVPYYGSSETTHPEAAGSRRLYPPDLDRTLARVAKERCAGCHAGGAIPRPFWTRITEPRLNSFLRAPLARADGGTGACGKVVFAGVEDPDYRAILATFDPVLAEMRDSPRIDMPGARVCVNVNRSCE